MTEVLNDLRSLRVDAKVIRADIRYVDEDIKELKGDVHAIRGDIAVIKSDLQNVATIVKDLRAEFRDFTNWIIVLSSLAIAFNVFATICFLTNFSFLTQSR